MLNYAKMFDKQNNYDVHLLVIPLQYGKTKVERWKQMKNDTLGERIFKELKNDILSGFYAPGERLLNEKVAERLGVSMTPVKDALLRLEQEGLVNIIPRRGCFVTQLTDRDIMEYSQIRMSLESLAIDLACTQNLIRPEDLKELTDINNKI